MSGADKGRSLAQLGQIAYDSGEKVSAEFVAITYGALVEQLVSDSASEDDVTRVNTQLYTIGHRIGSRLVEEYSVRSGAAPCKSFTQAVEAVGLLAFRMFLNVAAEVTTVSSDADTMAITFAENPLALFVELPDEGESPMRQQLWYSNVLCGVIAGALSLVGFHIEATFVQDRLRGHATNEIRLHFLGREKENFLTERS